MGSNDGFILMEFLKKLFAGWKKITILMVIGGLCGLGASKIMAPIYETRAVIAVTIDYTRTGALSDIQEDQAMRGLGSAIDSDAVREQVRQKAEQAGISIDRSSMAKNFTLERDDFRWFLRVRDSDAERAATLANLWVRKRSARWMAPCSMPSLPAISAVSGFSRLLPAADWRRKEMSNEPLRKI